ncbi:fimbria/pilus periplasmic chaperone [Enterobacter cloacae]|uniref:fimbria/pilus chaperone family protein n=1 Tax=Enterobacter cloacae TaxID=550 RepID=UPI0034A2B008
MSYFRRATGALLLSACLGIPFFSSATGMVPDTTVVLLDEAAQGGTINVKNTDTGPELLYVTVRDLKDDPRPQVIVTQPISRVEAGGTQQVRFVLTDNPPLTVQHLKRVTFEGIPVKKSGKNELSMTLRQDLPLIISPKGLADDVAPWKRLTWRVRGQHLEVNNSSPYVVRLSQQVQLLPSKQSGMLDKTYILPGETLNISLKTPSALAGSTQVRLFPATRYGFQAQDYTAPLTASTAGNQ